jgi:hypothetical protein
VVERESERGHVMLSALLLLILLYSTFVAAEIVAIPQTLAPARGPDSGDATLVSQPIKARTAKDTHACSLSIS